MRCEILEAVTINCAVENALSSCEMGGESETGQSSDPVMGAI